MPKSNKDLTLIDRLCSGFSYLLPDCKSALELAETGIERDLKLPEKLRLRYNRGLCLHCNCQQHKFDLTIQQMNAAQQARQQK
ncbi:hypothetical protein [Persicirhabdus sediminis]|uniref:Uncharacterized protein n=1 Tax=Persicirhabdus sediminis TaxID=454144 RepID=A0A8J7MDW5_9BACT|nr:hypothetical protein [Persicirhabdus sediminis]MBK1792054.1 hypothetical protein [Persicirhabdus sediminis]